MIRHRKTCPQCGASFAMGKDDGPLRWARRRFCSRPCARQAERNYHAPKTCRECGDSFTPTRKLTRAGWERQICCSVVCAARSRATRPLKERFEEKVCPEPNSGCHLWMGAIVPTTGYGSISLGPKAGSASTHCVSWTLYRGPIPGGLFVLHKCDVRPCVNPDHLFLGTHADNMADMIAKGRARHPPHKLTAERVLLIRRSLASGMTQRKVAAEHDISQGSVSRVASGENWSHV